jgi:hypothetical protein
MEANTLTRANEITKELESIQRAFDTWEDATFDNLGMIFKSETMYSDTYSRSLKHIPAETFAIFKANCLERLEIRRKQLAFELAQL